jgi:type VI secretion system protein VasD
MVLAGLVAMLAALAAGCGGPSITLAMAGLPNANPDATGRPSPVMLQMYELRSDLMFRQAEMVPLFSDPTGSLGADLIAYDEMTVLPGKAYEIEYEPTPETKFIGVMASFRRSSGKGPWKVIVPINPEDATKIGIELNSSSLVLIPADKTRKWDPVKAVANHRETSRAQSATVSAPAPSTEPAAGPAPPMGPAGAQAGQGQGFAPDYSPSFTFEYPPGPEAETAPVSAPGAEAGAVRAIKKIDSVVSQ